MASISFKWGKDARRWYKLWRSTDIRILHGKNIQIFIYENRPPSIETLELH